MEKRVLVAMSGGVDSSVSAYLLKKQGYNVTGVTMCLGIKDTERGKPRCCGIKAIEDAKWVCNQLDIPHYVFDFSTDLEEKVIKQFVEEYQKGHTPNPCIECNRSIKFGSLLKKALAMGFDYLATGHYARIEQNNGSYYLKRPRDRTKDQTYFLYPIAYKHLPYIIFPLSDLTKEEVRGIAKEAKLPIADKPGSQDICFIADGDYRTLLKERISDTRPGEIVDLEGRVLGKHSGICYYTLGQREGLGISSKTALYVIAIDAGHNRIVVGQKEALKSRVLIANNVNFLVKDFPKNVLAKIRYAHREALCSVRQENKRMRVTFDEAQEAITPGQSVVFYDGDTVLGGGIIDNAD